ncbi:hypothetical protein Tco_1165706 [Tanacetum coccineum]
MGGARGRDYAIDDGIWEVMKRRDDDDGTLGCRHGVGGAQVGELEVGEIGWCSAYGVVTRGNVRAFEQETHDLDVEFEKVKGTSF